MNPDPVDRHLPLVTIITATYNSSATIRDTLTSVAAQDYPAIEHIIVDGLSSDDTLSIVREYPHVARIISEKDMGIYDAMNKGIAATTGDIIGILNSDDFYVSGSIIRQVVQQMQEQQADALYGDLVYVHPQQTNRVLRTWVAGRFHPRKFLFGWMPPHPTFFVRRKVYQEWGVFNTSLRSAADYELMLRLLFKARVRVTYLHAFLVRMRAGGLSNASWLNRWRANREDRKAWAINHLHPYFYTTWLKPLRKLVQYFQKPNLSS